MPLPPNQLPAGLGIKGWLYAGRYGPERYLYLLQRVSGLGLLLYLFLHLGLTSTRVLSQEAWETSMALVSGPLFKWGEYLVVAGFIFHGLNGLRLILTELAFFIGKPSRQDYPYTTSVTRQKPLLYIAMTLALLLLIITAADFFFI
jgi:succinate dehydrogenase / fumarate reductase cytochrome b subunit